MGQRQAFEDSMERTGFLDWVEDPHPHAEPLALLLAVEEGRTHLTTGMTPTWTEEITRYDGRGPCPICSNPPRGRVVCLVCSQTERNPFPRAMQDPPLKARVSRLRGGRGRVTVPA